MVGRFKGCREGGRGFGTEGDRVVVFGECLENQEGGQEFEEGVKYSAPYIIVIINITIIYRQT